jgi:bacteriocin-like protein
MKDKDLEKKPAPKKGAGAIKKIKQGKAELTDNELNKVSGGQSGKSGHDFHV